jgi:transposase-like protein
MLSGITNAQADAELRLDLDQLVREGARRMLAAALEAEVDDYLAASAAERDEHGRRLVVRRVDPVTGLRARFRLVVLPPWCRKSPKVAEVLPLWAPVVAVGDGALGLWAALRDVFPETRHQRDWVHKAANVLGCLPKAVQAGARTALAEIRDAPDRAHAKQAIEASARDDGVKWPTAVAKITDDAEELLAFFDFPAEHWLHLVALVRAGARCDKGVLGERPAADAGTVAA